MKNLTRIQVKLLSVLIMAALLVIGYNSSPAFAVPIVFNLGYGGTVSYAGGDNPFVTTDGAVSSVSKGRQL